MITLANNNSSIFLMIIKDLRLETLNLQNRDLQSSRMQKFNSQRHDNPLRLFLTNRRHFIELGNVFFIFKLNNISMKRWKDIDIFETQVSMTNQSKLLTKHNTRYVVFFLVGYFSKILSFYSLSQYCTQIWLVWHSPKRVFFDCFLLVKHSNNT